MDTEKFIKKAKKVHGERYDYSLVKYKGTYDNIIIICPKHGQFTQRPNNHLTGSSCKECNKHNHKMGLASFAERANKIHKNKYDYSKSFYKNADTRLIIRCPEHGEFTQTPSKHLLGRGCPACGRKKANKKLSLSNSEFIEKAKKVHSEIYSYSLVEYKNSQTKIKIICSEHGNF